MRTRTRQSIRDEIREHADIVDDASVPDSWLNLRIDQAVAELWTLLVAYDDTRFLKSATLTATPGVTTYELATLPVPITDFYKMAQVEAETGTARVIITPDHYSARIRNGGLQPVSRSGRETYRIVKQGLDGASTAIEFMPGPSFTTYTLHYVQAPQLFADDDASMDGVAGWEDFVTVRVRRDVAEKREEVERYAWAQGQLLEMTQRIQREAARSSGPHYPADVYGLRR